MRVSSRAASALVLGALVALAGCSPQSPPADALGSYTDPGDGCRQAVSAVAYADTVLKPLGQEDYQLFDDSVRSRLSAVGGTLALEMRDWPDRQVEEQARRVQPLAEAVGALEVAGKATPASARALLLYRVEAARLVLLCRDAG